jgi:hypothetical protein
MPNVIVCLNFIFIEAFMSMRKGWSLPPPNPLGLGIGSVGFWRIDGPTPQKRADPRIFADFYAVAKQLISHAKNLIFHALLIDVGPVFKRKNPEFVRISILREDPGDPRPKMADPRTPQNGILADFEGKGSVHYSWWTRGHKTEKRFFFRVTSFMVFVGGQGKNMMNA